MIDAQGQRGDESQSKATFQLPPDRLGTYSSYIGDGDGHCVQRKRLEAVGLSRLGAEVPVVDLRLGLLLLHRGVILSLQVPGQTSGGGGAASADVSSLSFYRSFLSSSALGGAMPHCLTHAPGRIELEMTPCEADGVHVRG